MDKDINQNLNVGNEVSEYLGVGCKVEKQRSSGKLFLTYSPRSGRSFSGYELIKLGKTSFLRVIKNELDT